MAEFIRQIWIPERNAVSVERSSIRIVQPKGGGMVDAVGHAHACLEIGALEVGLFQREWSSNAVGRANIY